MHAGPKPRPLVPRTTQRRAQRGHVTLAVGGRAELTACGA